jgi:hypothetical protein
MAGISYSPEENETQMVTYACKKIMSVLWSARSSYYVGLITTSSRRFHIQLDVYALSLDQHRNKEVRLGILKRIEDPYL